MISEMHALLPETSRGPRSAKQPGCEQRGRGGREAATHNFQKCSALLAGFGFNCIKLADDWLGADFLAYHKDGPTTLRVQLKSRLKIDRTYCGQGLWMIFPADGSWYLVEHDELVRIVGEATNWLGTPSWTDRGAYSSARPSKTLLGRLAPYRVGDREPTA